VTLQRDPVCAKLVLAVRFVRVVRMTKTPTARRKKTGKRSAGVRSKDASAGAIAILAGPIGLGAQAMAHLNVSRAREEFPEIVNRAAYGKERTIVSRRGKDLAAVIPIEDLRLLERLAREEMDRADLEDARAALKEAEEEGTISLEEARKRLGL